MNGRDRSHDTPATCDSPTRELSIALHEAQRKLAERETLVAAAAEQTEAARAQYAQAAERVEALRRRLDTNVAELKTSRESITARDRRISSLERELKLRDDRIAELERMRAKDDSAQNAIDLEATSNDAATRGERLGKMGLVLESLDQPGTQYKIDRAATTIGRSSANDIAINSVSVSRYHARIVVEPEGVFLSDLHSKNGCSVNGRPVSRQMLGDGDAIAIGKCRFRFSVGRSSMEIEDRSMDGTFTLLDDAAFLTATSRLKLGVTQ